MLKRKKLVQSLDDLKLAGKLAMMIFGEKQDIRYENWRYDYTSIIDILTLNSIPLVYLYRNKCSNLLPFFKSKPFFTKLQAEQERYTLWKEEFKKVKDIFLKNNLHYLFIKTPSFFPYTSGNLDVLVREEDFTKACTLLEKEGFIELKNIREPYKYLYKKFNLGEEIVPIHLHSRIFWGSTFIDTKLVWSNAPRKCYDDVVFPLGAEDCLLTTLAHSFYENSAIRLLDLCIVKYLVEDSQLNWHYMHTTAAHHNWEEGYYLSLLLYDHLHREIFGNRLLPEDVYNEARSFVRQKILLENSFKRILRIRITLPFYLPLLLCKPLLYKKILQSQEFGKISHRIWILAKTLFDSFFISMLKVSPQMPMLISFSGIDGSGKSSYAQALKRAFEGCGLRTKYIWTRVGSLEGFQSLRKLRKVKSSSSIITNNPVEYFYEMKRYFSKSWRRILWHIINILDFCLFYNLKVIFALLRRRVVICDRYIPDIFVDLYTYPDNNSESIFWLKFLSKCLPNPDISILLDVSPEVALQRSKGKDCLKFLQRQAELYHKILKMKVSNLEIVNTEGEFQSICNSLINRIIKKYYRRRCVLFGWDQDK
jgi:dTMP kinase